jgi:hypothetical protein
MISCAEEEYIRRQAYVPEHVIPLMVGISEAEPFLLQHYLFFRKDDGIILIGYPLGEKFQEETFAEFCRMIQRKYKPAFLSLIAPAIPDTLKGLHERATDDYYRLDLPHSGVRRSLRREAEKAALALHTETSRSWSDAHGKLTREFLEKADLPPRIRELYLRMPGLLAHSATSLVLNAWDGGGNLAAFFVIERAAAKFTVYVVGCYSHRPYVPHASDLLLQKMIETAAEEKKEYIHLGLGVNAGIREFKGKWGGGPALHYEFGEMRGAPPGPLSWLKALQGRL